VTTGRADGEHPVMRVRRLSDGATIPAYQTEHAAGLDLHACLDEALVLGPGAIEIVPTGLAVAIPVGHEGQVRPRSGLASKRGVTLPNTPGTIDADYRGELRVPLINLGPEPFVVEPGMRIAQMVIAPVSRVRIEEVADEDALGSTVRGAGGFGSTGA